MTSPTFLNRIRAGQRPVGVVITLADPAVAEIFAQAGFEWLWLDAEHSPLDVADIQAIARAAAITNTLCLVRVPAIDEAWSKRVLESGVDGIIYPLVNTPEQAAQAVAWSKYPPLGRRSAGVGRAQGYGPRFDEYLAGANQRICTAVQIEHIHGVHNAQVILAVPGVDAVIVGPYDLSASMGKPGQVQDPEVRQAILSVQQAARAAGKPVGIFAGGLPAARQALEDGFDFLVAGMDCMLLSGLAAELARQVKAAIG